MVDYCALIKESDQELKRQVHNGWSFCKKNDEIMFIPRAIIENDVEFDNLIKEQKIKYFVFRFRAPQMGILATARNTIIVCEWASKHGLIPFIDFEWGYHYECDTLGTDNFFDYIFEQNITLEELWKENLICGDINWEYAHDVMVRSYLFGNTFDTRPNCIEQGYYEYYGNLKKYCDKWLKIKNEITHGVTSCVDDAHAVGGRVLGLAVREGFCQKDSDLSKGNLFLYHPHEPDIHEVIDEIKNYMSEHDFDYIYVTAQTEDTIEYLKGVFGDRLLYTERERPKRTDYYEASYRFHENNIESDAKKYYTFVNENTKEAKIINTYTKDKMISYVREILALSTCDAYLGGKSGGTIMACIWNGGRYETIKYWNDSHNSALY